MTLADKIEQADGPSRELDAEIAAMVRYFPSGVGFVWQANLKANSPEVGRVECETSLGTGGPHYKAPAYTASVDAALTLVPEGWVPRLLAKTTAAEIEENTSDKLLPAWSVGLLREDCAGYKNRNRFLEAFKYGEGNGAALAICAAALRARKEPKT